MSEGVRENGNERGISRGPGTRLYSRQFSLSLSRLGTGIEVGTCLVLMRTCDICFIMPHARFKLQLGVKKIHNRAAHFAGRDVNAMCMKKKKKKIVMSISQRLSSSSSSAQLQLLKSGWLMRGRSKTLKNKVAMQLHAGENIIYSEFACGRGFFAVKEIFLPR